MIIVIVQDAKSVALL